MMTGDAEAPRGLVRLLDGSKRCEISGFQWTRFVEFLRCNGYRVAHGLGECDAVVVNSCCVTESKAGDGEALVTRALDHPGVRRVILFGCLAETTEKFRESDRLIFVGPKHLSRIDDLFEHTVPIDNVTSGAIKRELFLPYQTKLTNDDHYVLVSQGCVHSCSYCNIKRAKGPVTSRSPAEILDEVRAARAAGRSEVVLLADDCGSYGGDLGTELSVLVAGILAVDPSVSVKLSTVFPGDFVRLFDGLARSLQTGRVTYMNIPLQSGSPRILSLMNRSYDVAAVLERIARVRSISPSTWLYTHMLVGFPTETADDVDQSLRAAAQFDETMFITYSENPRTQAAGIEPKVGDDEKAQRLEAIQAFLTSHAGILVDFKAPEPLGDQGPLDGEAAERLISAGSLVRRAPDTTAAARGPLRPAADTGANRGGTCKGVVQLTLTNRCQCNCSHCGVKDMSRVMGADMPLEQIDRLLGDIHTSGFGSVDLFGGEPTLRKDLVEIVRRGRAHGLEMLVETNAIAVDGDLLSELKQAGLFRIYVSLDDYEAKYHDENRGRPAFAHAVEVLNACRALGIEAHTSIVPRSREYFLDGSINRYVRFCLDNGAARVRILFPSYVGNCSDKDRTFCSEEDEISLLRLIDDDLGDRVYVESDFSYLRTVIAGGRIPCPAKSIFCHVTSSGLVMPCPYLPLVFGDAKRESMSEIFSRMMDHPALRQSGIYCPTRDERYLDSQLGTLEPARPYKLVASENHVDLGAQCNNHCEGCELGPVPREADDIARQIQAIDPMYGSIHLFGGEPFVRKDAFDLLGAVASEFALVIHTNARFFAYREAARRLAGYNVRCVKVPFFRFHRAEFDAFTKVKGSYDQTVAGIRNLSQAGIAVSIYARETPTAAHLRLLQSFGAVSISSYDPSDADPLPDATMCFGRRVGRTTLHWLSGSDNEGR
jgi:MiaB/RimO family radical SAM methylthiotransferase